MLWVSLFLLFSVFIYYVYGNGWIVNLEFFIVRDVVFKYLIGYLVEQLLSMDNIFVIVMIFFYFSIL